MRFEPGQIFRLPLILGLLLQALGCSSAETTDSGTGTGAPTGGSAVAAGGGGAQNSSSGGAPSTTAGSGTTASGGVTASGGASAGAGDLPCEVQAMLAMKCLSCHRVDPPGALLSAVDFARTSRSAPSKTVGQLALERVQATDTTRMPPAPLEAVTAAELSALQTWIGAGAPATSCSDTPVPIGPDPYDTPVVCTSMKNWTGGNRESPQMRPGGACISCHKQEGEGPVFAIAGTLFPTAHEPNDCNGVSSSAGAQVVITEASGTSHTLTVNNAGNFFLESRNFAYPYQAKVVYDGRERVMVEAQKDGDCNSCHTEAGTMKAPGRIFLP